jgi:hypothetical protein
MIVRISGEGQYELDDQESPRLNDLETVARVAVDEDRAADFATAYGALLDYVRANGRLVAEDELLGSDVILPPADLSFEEARDGREFTGEGLIPD